MSKASSSEKKKPAMSVSGTNKSGSNIKPLAKYQEKESQEKAAQSLVGNTDNKNNKKKN